jgi:hypothetical protein
MRFAGVSEEKVSPHLYLKLNGAGGHLDLPTKPPRLIAKHHDTTLEQLNTAQNNNPFNILTHA